MLLIQKSDINASKRYNKKNIYDLKTKKMYLTTTFIIYKYQIIKPYLSIIPKKTFEVIFVFLKKQTQITFSFFYITLGRGKPCQHYYLQQQITYQKEKIIRKDVKFFLTITLHWEEERAFTYHIVIMQQYILQITFTT